MKSMTATKPKVSVAKKQTKFIVALVEINFLPQMRLEVVVDDGQVEAAYAAISEAANTDKIGDGKIFVVNIDEIHPYSDR